MLKSWILKTSKFQSKLDISTKIEKAKNDSIDVTVFEHENKEKHPIYVSKNVDILLKGEEKKRHYALIKDFNTFMYDHFCRHCF